MIKKFGVFAMALVLVMIGTKHPVFAVIPQQATPIAIVVDGQQLSPDVPPFKSNGRVMLPLRAISEAMGLAVKVESNQPKEHNSQLVVSVGVADKSMTFFVGTAFYQENGGFPRTSDARFVLRDGRVFVPVRLIPEYFGGTVDWDALNNRVVIQSLGGRIDKETRLLSLDGLSLSAYTYRVPDGWALTKDREESVPSSVNQGLKDRIDYVLEPVAQRDASSSAIMQLQISPRSIEQSMDSFGLLTRESFVRTATAAGGATWTKSPPKLVPGEFPMYIQRIESTETGNQSGYVVLCGVGDRYNYVFSAYLKGNAWNEQADTIYQSFTSARFEEVPVSQQRKLELQFAFDKEKGTITKLMTPDTRDLVIIPEIEGIPVRAIAKEVLKTTTGWSSIVFPDTIVSISALAFPLANANGKYPTRITIGANVEIVKEPNIGLAPEADSFSGGFKSFYESTGRMAGTYVFIPRADVIGWSFDTGHWVKQ